MDSSIPGTKPKSPSTRQPTLVHLLQDAANQDAQRHLIFYPQGDTKNPLTISYRQLYVQARQNAAVIMSLDKFRKNHPILVHLDKQWDTILWCWSVMLAGGLPVISTPFSRVEEHRQKHIQGLSTLLQSPICITNTESILLFDGELDMHLHTVESLTQMKKQRQRDDVDASRGKRLGLAWDTRSHEETALLMLTSGSTGNAKAVELSHAQILAAVAGKASVRQLPKGRPMLNWIGMDHVASLVEIHVQALWLGIDQIHVHPSDVISSPGLFLDLLSKHRVCRSFAPNFFLIKLIAELESSLSHRDAITRPKWDLSSLTILASGGEANDVQVCKAVSRLLATYGAYPNVVTTGFGMTETCAGSIYNLDCPGYDMAQGRSIASLGKCIDGIEMRVTIGEDRAACRVAVADEPGYLELRGPVVFKRYYRSTRATAEAISTDGWFRTGDQACIGEDGNLAMIGRFKEVFNINGVKHEVADVQEALDRSLAGRVSRLVCFPSKTAGTEQVTVAYIPPSPPPADSALALLETDELAMQACMLSTGSRPLVFLLRDASLPSLPVSTLGKISRAKMRKLFEDGIFDQDVAAYDRAIREARQAISLEENIQCRTGAEASLMRDVAETLGVSETAMGLDSPFYSLGITSMDLIRLKNRIDKRLGTTLPIVLLMKHPTVRELAVSLEAHVRACGGGGATNNDKNVLQDVAVPYDPVVAFQTVGDKTPLWLIHPGVGEVLVFVGLVQEIAKSDHMRPVYALRARGFDHGQQPFVSITEARDTYLAAIRQRQPRGPYALAGYSYGTMLAFEVTKALEAAGETVAFLGSFNLPPHIRQRMQQLSRNACLLHLAQFLALVTEDFADEKEGDQAYLALPPADALRYILDTSDKARLQDLALSERDLDRWVDVAFGLQSMATDYEPEGIVAVIDVFHAIPLRRAARNRDEWIHLQLAKWKDFCASVPRFHAVGGAHYTMLGPDHVQGFAVELIGALRKRDI
ncbi:uncharacterized protein PgNI_09348 [Pyricularia grisea]|uniref:Carrier domain-containing protein n=1 Tax=Pyricularia grisea TaxID=148305 RepID=A0A6P8ASY0_PYRGI|nr:uncharacterized protein PgNI_09348 [Pyricularia grisea]TLD05231.1 hypothetical protein PgNI_09348 [Pyricularia grisea]